jgi:4-hydroxybenzoate polyprenyltransferase/sugar phosphate isomerase/epimerase
MRVGRNFHLTYCSNIHEGETWTEIDRSLRTYLPQVRQKIGYAGSFGVGLRLSAQAAIELEAADALESFQRFLQDQDFYVFTINGFPYGPFHGQRIKENVYLPDWRDPRRLDYTNRLARILSKLIPPDVAGSVNTVPGAFKPAVVSVEDVSLMASNILQHARVLKELHGNTGRTIRLAIEPEPCCHIETIEDAIRFFSEALLDPALLGHAGLREEEVRASVGICFDACHMAVEYESPADAVNRLRNAGIEIFKVQVSAGLRIRSTDPRTAVNTLEPFAESTYLHQVVLRNDQRLRRFADLPDAFHASTNENIETAEWRVHFHVPVFLSQLHRDLSTTQNYLVELLRLLRNEPVCPFLEVETYTWNVLPQAYTKIDVVTAIARELTWVREHVAMSSVPVMDRPRRTSRPGWLVYLSIGRVSNLPAVWTNCLAGISLAGGRFDSSLTWLLVAFSLLYLAGTCLNDAFDAEFDRRHHPGRPIPAGDISTSRAYTFGFVMLGAGIWLIGSRTQYSAQPLVCSIVLAALILYFDYRHQKDSWSPFVLTLCRVMIYITSAAVVGTAWSSEVAIGALSLAGYLVGLTYIAKQKSLDEVRNLWPLVLLALPMVYLFRGANLLAGLLLVGWTIYAVSFLLGTPRRVGLAITGLIAGTSLLDAMIISAIPNHNNLAVWAVVGFAVTLILQKFVPRHDAEPIPEQPRIGTGR